MDSRIPRADTERDGPSPQQIADALQRGERPSERHFDRFLPAALRVSHEHWTPLAVALRVAQWLRELHVTTIVDVGAGAGKFCVALALASECEITGVEQRPQCGVGGDDNRPVTVSGDLANVVVERWPGGNDDGRYAGETPAQVQSRLAEAYDAFASGAAA